MSVAFSTSGQVKRTSGNTIALTVNNTASYTLVFVVGNTGMSITDITIGSDILVNIHNVVSGNYKISAYGCMNSSTGPKTLTINGNTSWFGAHAAIFDNCSRAQAAIATAYPDYPWIPNSAVSINYNIINDAQAIVSCVVIGWSNAANADQITWTSGCTKLGEQEYGSSGNHPPMSAFSYGLKSTGGNLIYNLSMTPEAINSGAYMDLWLYPYKPFTGRGYILQ